MARESAEVREGAARENRLGRSRVRGVREDRSSSQGWTEAITMLLGSAAEAAVSVAAELVVEAVEATAAAEAAAEAAASAAVAVTWETPDPRRTPPRRPTAQCTIPRAGSTAR